jgi:hypothetical protein
MTSNLPTPTPKKRLGRPPKYITPEQKLEKLERKRAYNKEYARRKALEKKQIKLEKSKIYDLYKQGLITLTSSISVN